MYLNQIPATQEKTTALTKTTPSSLAELKAAIRKIANHQASVDAGEMSYLQAQTLEFDKWRLIHKFVHSSPFRTRTHQKRSEQWREAAKKIRDIGEIEVLDWTLLQAEVASNLERGIQDMRPRKGGPCHPLLLEYVSDRKRKANAILHFAIAGESKGTFIVNSKFHAETEAILQRSSTNYEAHDEGHEVLPWSRAEDPKN